MRTVRTLCRAVTGRARLAAGHRARPSRCAAPLRHLLCERRWHGAALGGGRRAAARRRPPRLRGRAAARARRRSCRALERGGAHTDQHVSGAPTTRAERACSAPARAARWARTRAGATPAGRAPASRCALRARLSLGACVQRVVRARSYRARCRRARRDAAFDPRTIAQLAGREAAGAAAAARRRARRVRVMRRARLCAQVDGVGYMHVGRVVPPAVRSESPRSRARPAPGSMGPWRPAGRRCHQGRDPRSGGLECRWALKEGSWRCRRVRLWAPAAPVEEHEQSAKSTLPVPDLHSSRCCFVCACGRHAACPRSSILYDRFLGRLGVVAYVV